MTDEYDPLAAKLHGSTDAQVWARTFLSVIVNSDVKVDEAFMTGWFANAIETGRNAGRTEEMVSLWPEAAWFMERKP